MIKNLTITNFQSHKESYLEFDPGVNAITGRSDIGKTTILRALNWVVNNKPSGFDFKKHDADFTYAQIEFEEGIKIERYKSKKENSYSINGEKLKALGQSVPEEVKKIINLNSINFQSQQDAPFLLSQSSGEVARYLNKIVNLNSIDNGLINIKREMTQIKNKQENIKIQIDDKKEELKQFENLKYHENKLIEIEQKEKIVNNKKSQILLLEQLINLINELNKKKNSYQWIDKAKIILTGVKQKGHDFKTAKIKIETLKNITQKINSLKDQLKDYQIITKNKNKIYGLVEKNKTLKEKIILITLLKKLTENIKKYIIIKETISKKESRFHQALKKLKICPLCNSEIKGE